MVRMQQLSMFHVEASDVAYEMAPIYEDLIAHPSPLALPLWAAPIDRRFTLAFGVRIDGEPQGKKSVRVKISRPVKAGGKLRARGTQHPVSKAYEACLAELSAAQPMREGHARPLGGPLIVRVLAVKSRVKVLSAEAIPYVEGDVTGRRYCPVTPDWDNIGKSVGDGLKKGKILRDDAKIVDGRVTTLYGAIGEEPFVETFVWALPSWSCGG